MATKAVQVGWNSGNQNFPSGTTLGLVHVTLSGGPAGFVPLEQDTSGVIVVFPDVPEEAETDPDYLATVQQLDGTGAPLGSALQQSFSIIAPPATLRVPESMYVTVGLAKKA